MAQRRRRKRSWLKTFLLITLTPLLFWAFAFAVWFFWYDIMRLLEGRGGVPGKGDQATHRVETPRNQGPQEQIKDEDRRKLEKILKERR